MLAARPIGQVAGRLIAAGGTPGMFRAPLGEGALLSPDSVSWQIFRNPVTMFIGGIAAVLMELGEPRVRSAVWQHSSFRNDPAGRLRRTGFAAMVTVYAARSVMVDFTARIRRMHAGVVGETPDGQAYRASDPALLRWVQGTAAFAFVEAHQAYLRPLLPSLRARYYAEGIAGGTLYGVEDVPASEAAMQAMLAGMQPFLTPSPILGELITLVRDAAILPFALRGMQHLIVRAAVDLLPETIRNTLALGPYGGLAGPERLLLRALARMAETARFPTSPAAQACRRLGLPGDYLLRRPLA